MRIVIQNEYGRFEAGSSRRFAIHITDIAGIGLLSKEVTGVSFAGQPGRTVTAVRDTERTITIAFEIYGGAREIEKIYRCIYHPVDIIFFLDDRRRRISGRCVNAADAEKIIYHRLNKLVLQFVCDDPYFHDYDTTQVNLNMPVNKLPNTLDGGEWYITLPTIATEIITRTDIINYGDTILYPVFKVKRQAAQAMARTAAHGLVLTNHTTGKTLEINYEITADDELTIDLDRRKIISAKNGVVTGSLADGSVMSEFCLLEGKNDISAESLNLADLLEVTVEYNNNYTAVMI